MNGAPVHERCPFVVVQDEYISTHLERPPFGWSSRGGNAHNFSSATGGATEGDTAPEARGSALLADGAPPALDTGRSPFTAVSSERAHETVNSSIGAAPMSLRRAARRLATPVSPSVVLRSFADRNAMVTQPYGAGRPASTRHSRSYQQAQCNDLLRVGGLDVKRHRR